jgi:hypothetical protein
MLTAQEREFYDVWLREDCGYPARYATPLSYSRGITYDHYARMWPFYVQTWHTIREWLDGFPPIPPNPTLLVPGHRKKPWKPDWQN